jgi:ElaB/YqjD/DUF883 family membrane-anchored ribosome-binding protein
MGKPCVAGCEDLSIDVAAATVRIGAHDLRAGDDLQASFTELRADLASLLTNTVDTGKSGAAVMKNGASSTIQELQGRLIQAKERGLESLEKVGEQIHKHPIISSAVAMGIGFILAKLLTMRSSAKYSD